MDNLYGKAVALAVPVFLFLIALELIVDRARYTRCYNLADSINSLSCGIVSTGVRVFFGFLGIFFTNGSSSIGRWCVCRPAIGAFGFSHSCSMIFATTGIIAGVTP